MTSTDSFACAAFAVVSDNTHLALFVCLMGASALAVASALVEFLVLIQAKNRLGEVLVDGQRIQSDFGFSFYLSLIACVLLILSCVCSWQSKAFQTCRPSHAVYGADDGRNEKVEEEDKFAATRGMYGPGAGAGQGGGAPPPAAGGRADPFGMPGGGPSDMGGMPPMGGPPGGADPMGGMGGPRALVDLEERTLLTARSWWRSDG